MASESADPRIVRTRRDVVDAAASLLLDTGWSGVTHAAVANRSGYAKATVYTHWPTRLDLVRDAVDRICDAAQHPQPTGDLIADLTAGLTDFAADLSEGRLARVLGGVIEQADTDPIVAQLRKRLYDAGTSTLRTVLEAHLPPDDVDPVLSLLTGAIFTRVAFEARPADPDFVAAVIKHVV